MIPVGHFHLSHESRRAFIDLGDRKIDVFYIPGHTNTDIAYYDDTQKYLLTETVFTQDICLPLGTSFESR